MAEAKPCAYHGFFPLDIQLNYVFSQSLTHLNRGLNDILANKMGVVINYFPPKQSRVIPVETNDPNGIAVRWRKAAQPLPGCPSERYPFGLCYCISCVLGQHTLTTLIHWVKLSILYIFKNLMFALQWPSFIILCPFFYQKLYPLKNHVILNELGVVDSSLLLCFICALKS